MAMHCEVIVKVVHNDIVAQRGVGWLELVSVVIGARRLLEAIKEGREREVSQTLKRRIHELESRE